LAKRTTNRAAKTSQGRKLAIELARICEHNNCTEIVVLDVTGISPVTDYFIIATGTSGRQMRAVADDVGRYGKSVNQPPWHVAGLDAADWIVLDFVDVVVHLFDEAHRRYYDLELIWGESPKVRWRKPKARTSAPE
jgi:ribosome-associated protein